MSDKRKKIIDVIFYASVLSFLLIFFIQLHPLCILEADDWCFIRPQRSFLPMKNHFNPARVLPEILMPAVANIGAFVINPLRNDYIWSLAIAFGIFVSVCIVIYCFVFERFINNKFKISKGVSLLITGLFLLFHFWAFRSKQFNNPYLFHCWDVTCYFFYLIPNLLNAVLVMTLDCNKRLSNLFYDGDWVKKSFLLLALYLAVFSNLYTSIVICVYSGIILLCEIVSRYTQLKKDGVKEFFNVLKQNCTHVIVIAFWLISAFFELNGGRAQSLNSKFSWKLRLTEAISRLYKLIKTMNKGFFVVSLITVIVALIIFFASKNKTAQDMTYIKMVLKYTGCLALTAIYLVLLCARSIPSHISRVEIFMPIAFFAFLVILTSLIYICKKVPASILLLPLLVCYAIVNTDTCGKTFRDPPYGGSEIAYKISTNIVEQIIYASKNGDSKVDVYVPTLKDPNSWPLLKEWARGCVGGALYQHHIISKPIAVKLCPDETLNAMYGVN